jgi:hypothetical protein
LPEYVEAEEIIVTYKIIDEIFKKFETNEIEYGYFLREDGMGKYSLLLKKEGERGFIKFSEAERNKINASENTMLLSFIHNHPDSGAFSIKDYVYFIAGRTVKKFTVFGMIGNLYFLQKQEPEIWLAEDKQVDALEKELEELFALTRDEFSICEMTRYNAVEVNDYRNVELRAGIYRDLLHNFFFNVCHSLTEKLLRFDYYPKEAMNNGA